MGERRGKGEGGRGWEGRAFGKEEKKGGEDGNEHDEF